MIKREHENQQLQFLLRHFCSIPAYRLTQRIMEITPMFGMSVIAGGQISWHQSNKRQLVGASRL